MDLAKIRKKSLLSLGDECSHTPLSSPEPINNTLETVQVALIPTEENLFQIESPSVLITPLAAETSFIAATPPEHIVNVRTPLETILAGRLSAGCDDESILADDDPGEIVAETCLEFLCFRVSDEIYGINIMEIKEIIKPREVTEVPRAPAFVSGVLSLRGTIIPIIDMRVRLDLARQEHTGKERVVVIKNNNSLSGLLVDEVTQVVQVQLDAVEPAPTVLEGIDRDFISGLGRSDGQLIIILNLENIADINLY